MELLNRVAEQYRSGLPFAVYRKPGQAKVRAFFQKDRALETVNDFTEKGFVMAPFVSGEYPRLLIRPDDYVEVPFEDREYSLSFDSQRESGSDQEKELYLQKIGRALAEIELEKLRKVVLSRRITFESKTDPVAVFKLLLQQFPNAFGYLLYHPSIGIWMGASPETLLQFSQTKISTISLAGTQKVKEQTPAVWTEKELREQEYVTRYIVRALDNLQNVSVTGPETARAGNLYHLKSRIEAPGPQSFVGELIRALHPTPAVCGIPADKAREFLLANEGYPRAYYSGFLGELNWGSDHSSHLFVNLRCMNFEDGQIHIYVGGGLVEGSDPELEWVETVYKSESMKHLILNSQVKLG